MYILLLNAVRLKSANRTKLNRLKLNILSLTRLYNLALYNLTDVMLINNNNNFHTILRCCLNNINVACLNTFFGHLILE